MHRLDFETHGLVLFAKNVKSFDFFTSLQDNGDFVKEYSAVCAKADKESGVGSRESGMEREAHPSPDKPLVIESFFRPFGPGRKQVRPVTDATHKYAEIAKDRGSFYRTEITTMRDGVFTVRLRRGFRHQIRCHLCWAGFPILNDPLYPVPVKSPSPDGYLALRAHALRFRDPCCGGPLEFHIPPLERRP